MPTALPMDVEAAPVRPSADRAAALALSLVPNVGPVTYRRWAIADGDAAAAFARRVGTAARDVALAQANEALARGAACGATLLLMGDAAYPSSLLALADPPSAVWALGDVGLLERDAPNVAIVGTRAATPYGLRIAARLASALAAERVTVVSGMAIGIDAAAHVAALDAAGPTIAVLGSGVDVAYPRAHRALHRRIVQHGLVISEMPPGAAPTAGAFPRRNRIVAALARATLVVEAGLRSGALITASLALELGREVGAVPGPVDVAQSAGTNALLRDGAAMIAEPRDLLELIGMSERRVSQARAAPPGLGADEDAVWRALSEPAIDIDALASRVTITTRACLTALGALEVSGLVRVGLDGSVARA